MICFEKITEQMVDVVATRCHHWTHTDCLSKWIDNGRSTCPLCRFNIKYTSAYKSNTIESDVLRKLDILRYKYELLIKLIKKNKIE